MCEEAGLLSLFCSTNKFMLYIGLLANGAAERKWQKIDPKQRGESLPFCIWPQTGDRNAD